MHFAYCLLFIPSAVTQWCFFPSARSLEQFLSFQGSSNFSLEELVARIKVRKNGLFRDLGWVRCPQKHVNLTPYLSEGRRCEQRTIDAIILRDRQNMRQSGVCAASPPTLYADETVAKPPPFLRPKTDGQQRRHYRLSSHRAGASLWRHWRMSHAGPARETRMDDVTGEMCLVIGVDQIPSDSLKGFMS